MEYVEVRGARVPALGLGTWQMEGRTCREAVEAALELGYRHIDTAQMYGNEGEVGAAVRESGIDRDALWITTKLGIANVGRDAVLRTTHESLKRLATDRIDLLLIHWPSDQVPLRETFGAMGELMDDGAVRRIGVSNFPPGLLKEALSEAPISCIQVEYHPFLSQDELVEMAQDHELMLTAYSPLARGRVQKSSTLTSIGKRYGKSPAQVALRWLIQQKSVAAIPKASQREHLAQNIDLFDFRLTPDEVHTISELDRGQRLIDPDFAPDWSYA